MAVLIPIYALLLLYQLVPVSHGKITKTQDMWICDYCAMGKKYNYFPLKNKLSSAKNLKTRTDKKVNLGINSIKHSS